MSDPVELIHETVADLEAWLASTGLELRVKGRSGSWSAHLHSSSNGELVAFGRDPDMVMAIRRAIADSGVRKGRGEVTF